MLCWSGRAQQTLAQNTLCTHSLCVTRPEPSEIKKARVLDVISKTLASPAGRQTVPNKAVKLSLWDLRDTGGEMEQLQGQWRGLCAALERSQLPVSWFHACKTHQAVGSLRPHKVIVTAENHICECNKRQKTEPTLKLQTLKWSD